MKKVKRISAAALAMLLALWVTAAFFPARVPVYIEAGAASADGSELSVASYKPISTKGFARWNGASKPVEGKNYYISSTVKVKGSVTLPEGSTLVLREGSELQVFGGGKLVIKGKLLIEPSAKLTVSGKLSVSAGGVVENYGSAAGTKSSDIALSGELVTRRGAETVLSGAVNIFSQGSFLNYGTAKLTRGCVMTVTGAVVTGEKGRLYCAGMMKITLGGTVSQGGCLSLSGTVYNSGIFTFEDGVTYYRATSGKFSATKSGRVIDYRRNASGGVSVPPLGISSEAGIKGIDVSRWQGTIGWERVRSAGVEFAMIRASAAAYEDIYFDYNVTEARRCGIEVGVYHYLYAQNEQEAREEAHVLLNTIAGRDITYPVVLDIEDNSQIPLGKEKVTSIAKAFLEEVRAAGYYPMIYSYKAWLQNFIDMTQLSDYDVWLAQWSTMPTYDGKFTMWQYSATGAVSGINGAVDLDISFVDYKKIIAEGGYNKR